LFGTMKQKMLCAFNQTGPTINGIPYPKAIESTLFTGDQRSGNNKQIQQSKSILGIYIRDRMGVSHDKLLDLKDFEKYGRFTIDVIGPTADADSYYMDFHV
jgi:hypothetical protein